MKKLLVGVSVIAVSLALSVPGYVHSKANHHARLTYKGPAMCLKCHKNEARDVHGSNHYQWLAPAPYMTTGPSIQGKLTTAFNSY